MVKVAKYTNIVVGSALVVTVIADFLTLGFLSPFHFTISIFVGLFGLLIVSSSFGAKFVVENYLFIMTGKGRGIFNIFVGTLLFITTAKASVASVVMGILLCCSGVFILFLSCYTGMSDVEIQQNMGVTKQDMLNVRSSAGNLAA